MCHYSTCYNISTYQFYGKEWIYFWEKKDINRLMTALIINEQNKIQKPVIENTYFKKHVFHTALLNCKKCFMLVLLFFQPLKEDVWFFSLSI